MFVGGEGGIWGFSERKNQRLGFLGLFGGNDNNYRASTYLAQRWLLFTFEDIGGRLYIA